MIEIPLLWPNYRYKTKEIEGKTSIFDPIRKKYVFLSPEEWVRQHVLNYLIEIKKYPRGFIKVESGLDFNTMKKRSDVLVFDLLGKPYILVECKATAVKINQEGINQASRYNFKYRAPFLLLTNGLQNLLFRIDWENSATEQIFQIPDFET